jgi:copper(I)-binding protein
MVVLVSAGAAVLSAQKSISASNAWVKVPAAGETSAMAFVNIDNPTMYDVFFTSGTSNAAGKVELRDKSKGADPKAQAVEFITVPAYGSLTMDQNGVYVALLELKRPLKQGDMVSLTLSSQDGAKVDVMAAVRAQ